MRLFLFVLISSLFFFASIARADLFQELESGDFSALQKLKQESRAQGQESQALFYDAVEKFYAGNLDAASEVFAKLKPLPQNGVWIASYIQGALPLLSEMQTVSSEHFILKMPARDVFLKNYAFEALEKAYAELGKDFGVLPSGKIPAEIYPTQESFSRASTLSIEILDKSGAIGICKFRRLMISSPEQMAYGYRWLDTLSHEYAHYLINILSHGRCPLWLHEGIAKHFETRWRLAEPAPLTPGNRTELARAIKDGKLIPFSRMEPSMVYLDDQAQVRQAFSEVSQAVEFIVQKKGVRGVADILKGMASGLNREEAFQAVLGWNTKEFEAAWTDALVKEGLEESPGSAPDVIRSAKDANEIDEFVQTDARAHLRLGDRMKQSGRADAALIQYQKTLAQEPNNPVALTKMARLEISNGNLQAALPHLETCVRENPNYAPGFLLLGDQKIAQKDWPRALELFREANALNPFNPAVHDRLTKIFEALGKTKESKEESEVLAMILKR